MHHPACLSVAWACLNLIWQAGSTSGSHSVTGSACGPCFPHVPASSTSHPAKAPYLFILLKTVPGSCTCLQAVVIVAPPRLAQQLFSAYLQHNLPELAVHLAANFVVQAALTATRDSATIREALAALSGKFKVRLTHPLVWCAR